LPPCLQTRDDARTRQVLTVALIGYGAIGHALVQHLMAAPDDLQVVGALVSDTSRHDGAQLRIFDDPDVLLQLAPDVIVECARQQALREIGPLVLRAGVPLIAASVGALADQATYDSLATAAVAGGTQLCIAAGALAGIDALAAARYCGVSSVRYARRAPPEVWVKSGALNEDAARALREAHVVFEGSARVAARQYPKNANVAATVALAGVGFERTTVELIADPGATANVHEIEAEGAFGHMRCAIAARPISSHTSSSAIVAGSLARSVMMRSKRIVV
jgi:aspartate dehydrogenase